MPQIPIKTLEFNGKKIKYKSIVDLSKKLKITREQAKKYIQDFKNNNTKRFIVNNEGGVIKYDIKEKKPLILQEFLQTNAGIKKIRNKKLLDLKITGWNVVDTIKSNIPLQLTIKGNVLIGFSPPNVDSKPFSFQIDTAPDNIDSDLIITQIELLFDIIYDEEDPNIEVINYQIVSTLTGQTLNIVDMEMREQEPLKLTSLFNDIVYNDNSGNCIQKYLNDIHPKISTKIQNKLKTTNDILEYSKRYGIRMIAYDITGKVICENYEVKKKGRYKNINFICFNNHLYPLLNNKLQKITPKKIYDTINIFTDNIYDEFEDLLHNKKYYPKFVMLDGAMEIKQFSYIDIDDNYYNIINNPDYEICKLILKEFGLLDQLTHYTNLKNIYKIIETLYLKSNIDSFLPDNKQFIKSAFNYNNNENIFELKELNEIDYTIETMDKNKCYSWALRILKFLISVDIKTNKWSLYNGEEIIDHYLYIVSPHQSSILLPDDNIYSGNHLLYSKKQGLNFNIIEVLVGDKHDNYYKEMIDDLVNKCDNNSFKTILNIMIGKFERNTEIVMKRTVEEVVNEDQSLTKSGHYMKLPFDSNYKLKYNFSKDYNILNRKPIAIQIKDASRVILYEQLIKCKLSTDDIIQVKTDSFTYKNRGQDFSKYINKNIDGWKLEPYKKINSRKPIKKLKTFKYQYRPNLNRFYDCYAGCGKSTFIKGEITNLFINNNNTDYRVLTPSHSTLKDYKKNNFICNVIQKNTYFNTLPQEQNIYIDEMGMCDRRAWNFIYTMYLAGKNIYAFGDFKQLLPPIDKYLFTEDNFINKVFSNRLNFDSNFRNNFDKDYYDKLINSADRKWLISEVNKYNTKYFYEAETIIAYKNSERKKYNLKMLIHEGFKTIYDSGVKIIAKDNELRKIGVFNKFNYTIKSVKGDTIIITDDIEDIEINKKQYDSHFDLGYCRTLYSIQGETLNSFHFVNSDYHFLKNREIYTLISRLKQKKMIIPDNYKPFDFMNAKIKIIMRKCLDDILKIK